MRWLSSARGHPRPPKRHAIRRPSQERSRRSWRGYVEDDIETDPVELVEALGLVTVSKHASHHERVVYKRIYRALLLDELERLHEHLDGSPTPTDMRTFGTYAPRDYVDLFGSWTEALQAAGLPVPSTTTAASRRPEALASLEYEWLAGLFGATPSEEELISELRAFAGALGTPPKPIDMRKFGPRRPIVYTDCFGTWEDALSAAGIPTAPSATAGEPSTPAAPTDAAMSETAQDLRDELRDLARAFDAAPTKDDVSKFTPYTVREYVDAFGSWAQALAAAGIKQDQQSTIETTAHHSEDARRWARPIGWVVAVCRWIGHLTGVRSNK